MESLAYVSFDLALRLCISAIFPGDSRIGDAVRGLIEGVVLRQLFHQSLSQQYIAFANFALCLLVDYAVTKSWPKLVVMVLSAGVGVLLYDILRTTLWHHHPCSCSRCQLRTNVAVSRNPHRRLSITKSTSPLLVLASHPSMSESVHGQEGQFMGAALLPDPIDDDLGHLRSLSCLFDEGLSSTSPSSSLGRDPCHQLPTLAIDSKSNMSKSSSLSCASEDGLDRICFPLESHVSSEVPVARELQPTPTSSTVSAAEAPAGTPLTEGDVGLINEQDEQTPTQPYEHITLPHPISDAKFAVDQLSESMHDKAVSLTSSNKFSKHPDEWDDLESEVSPPSSVLSVDGREELISHAELIRQMAVETDQMCIRLETNRNHAMEAGRIKEAFLLKQQIEDAKIISRRLHERAERRYYRGA
jgi:hypothetical protein